MQKISCSNFQKIANNVILRFPKLTSIFVGSFAKFCFCKGKTFPILFFPMIYILLFILQKTRTSKYASNSFFIGFFFGVGYFGSSLYWVAESFKCVGFGDYGYIAVTLLICYLSIYTGFTCMLTKILSTTRKNMIVFFALFWTILEYIRGWAFTGFPWNLAGYSTYEIPYFSQISDIFGIYGISFIFILIISFLTYKKTIIHGVLLFLITISYGYYKTEIYDNYTLPENQNLITLVQPSIPQEEKMDLRLFKENINKHIDISYINEIYKGKKLIIWPEAAVNIPINTKKKLIKYLSSSIKHPNTFIVFGTDRIDNNKNLYNSACVIGKDSKIYQFYDKRHLLPFGEFIPEFLLNLGIKKVTNGIINFTSGCKKRTIEIEGFEKFELIICYEIAFPGKIVDNKDSKWILNITNDSWFKNSDGPSQHLRTTCFRAIEEGKSIARCANNGISCIINCNGKIIKKLNTDEIGKINSIMPQKHCFTIFSKYGNKTILILLGLFLILAIIKRRYNKLLSFIFQSSLDS